MGKPRNWKKGHVDPGERCTRYRGHEADGFEHDHDEHNERMWGAGSYDAIERCLFVARHPNKGETNE